MKDEEINGWSKMSKHNGRYLGGTVKPEGSTEGTK